MFAKRPISKFTQFGPFVGELTEQEVMLTNSGMPIMVSFIVILHNILITNYIFFHKLYSMIISLWVLALLRKHVSQTKFCFLVVRWFYSGTCCLYQNYWSLVVRKPGFCICENKDADQLRGNREADQRLCFRFTDTTITLLSKSEISSF